MKTSVASFLAAAGAMMLAGFIPTSAHAQAAPLATQAPSVPAEHQQLTPIQRMMGGFAPKLVDLTDNVLFDDVWERSQLSKRDRSLATVSALVAMNRPDQLRSHLARRATTA
jgi:4-carboxymuconolactone decarboxylase